MSETILIKQIKAKGDPKIAEHSQRFFKTGPGEYGEGDQFLGVRVPELRKIAKANRSIPLVEITQLLRSPYHEIRLTGLLILTYKMNKATAQEQKEIAEFYMDHIDAVNNWDLVDSSCHKILGPYLQNRDRSRLYEMARSHELWQNRIAVITCMYFIDQKDYRDALQIATILLYHDHDLIHKAVGWILREIGKKDRSVEEDFLKLHYRNMPRTMLRYAIEQFEEPLRQQYLRSQI